MTNRNDRARDQARIRKASAALDAIALSARTWAYYDGPTSRYWLATRADLLTLADMIDAMTPDVHDVAISRWCAETDARPVTRRHARLLRAALHGRTVIV